MAETNPSEPDDGDLLRAGLARREVLCPHCRYDLRGAEGDRCPECGAGLRLYLGFSDLRLGWWIASVLGVALPLGFVSIAVAIQLLHLAIYRFAVFPLSTTTVLVGCMLALAIALGVALALLWRRRARFWGLSGRRQRSLALLCLSLPTATVLAWYFVLLRLILSFLF